MSVPRVPVGQGGQRGEMAWWVADESMKAHVVSGAERPGKMSGAEALLAANAGPAEVGFFDFRPAATAAGDGDAALQGGWCGEHDRC